jgi:hypothetical protein
MSPLFLQSIDWERPWLAPLRSIAQPILQSANWRDALNEEAASLKNHRGLPIRFVPQTDLPPKTSYEAFISDTGQVPTRENLHDFFNAMVWLTFPKTKAQLNAIQAAEIAKAIAAPAHIPTPHSSRGKTRDAATIFDENVALLVTSDAQIVEALRNHEWRNVFVAGREAFLQRCEVYLFGHAVMEKLVLPYKAITAHAWIVDASNSFFIKPPTEKQAWVDARVSEQLTCGLLTSLFTPLPVLGVPSWWENNQQEMFYDDSNVFRQKRTLRK